MRAYVDCANVRTAHLISLDKEAVGNPPCRHHNRIRPASYTLKP